jgi:8-hydroxy-5-deazaflavin:NADPH oxidoreductase
MVRELGPHASVGTPLQGAEFGAVLLLAVPFEAVSQVGRELHIRANGVEQTVAKYLPVARLVRAFSCVDAIVRCASRSRLIS